MKPAISILVPVYNVESHISKCLDSILAQTLTDFEVIVVNDGSTDRSGIICDAYAKKDKRIRVIHQSNEGVSSARNKGVELTKGRYIGFVDGDDYIDARMYETLYRLCIEKTCDIAICQLARPINDETVNSSAKFLNWEMDNLEAMKQLFKGVLYRFSLCNKLFRKKCFNGILFPEGRIHEDLSTTYKLFSKAKKVIYTSEPIYVYLKRKNSILTSKYDRKRLDAFLGWDEILPFMEQKYPQLIREVYTCFSYNCVDHIYAILHQVKDKDTQKSFLANIQQCIKRHYEEIKKYAVLSIAYRSIFVLLRSSIRLFILTNHVKKKVF